MWKSELKEEAFIVVFDPAEDRGLDIKIMSLVPDFGENWIKHETVDSILRSNDKYSVFSFGFG